MCNWEPRSREKRVNKLFSTWEGLLSKWRRRRKRGRKQAGAAGPRERVERPLTLTPPALVGVSAAQS